MEFGRMHRTNRILVLIFAALLFSLICNNSAAAQSNEVALTVGGYFPVSLSAGNSFAVEGNVAHRILHVPLAAVYVEVPIAGTTGSQSNELIAITCVISGCPPIANNYTALFVTPGLKLKLAPSFPISPYVAA